MRPLHCRVSAHGVIPETVSTLTRNDVRVRRTAVAQGGRQGTAYKPARFQDTQLEKGGVGGVRFGYKQDLHGLLPGVTVPELSGSFHQITHTS